MLAREGESEISAAKSRQRAIKVQLDMQNASAIDFLQHSRANRGGSVHQRPLRFNQKATNVPRVRAMHTEFKFNSFAMQKASKWLAQAKGLREREISFLIKASERSKQVTKSVVKCDVILFLCVTRTIFLPLILQHNDSTRISLLSSHAFFRLFLHAVSRRLSPRVIADKGARNSKSKANHGTADGMRMPL